MTKRSTLLVEFGGNFINLNDIAAIEKIYSNNSKCFQYKIYFLKKYTNALPPTKTICSTDTLDVINDVLLKNKFVKFGRSTYIRSRCIRQVFIDPSNLGNKNKRLYSDIYFETFDNNIEKIQVYDFKNSKPK